MATKKSQVKNYTVYANLKLDVGTTITAQTFEEAAATAAKLTPQDFITIDGDYNDGEVVAVTGIYLNSD